MDSREIELIDAATRIREVGRILALGLIRLRARQSSQLSETNGESCLDFSPDQRGHADRLTNERHDDES